MGLKRDWVEQERGERKMRGQRTMEATALPEEKSVKKKSSKI